MAIWSRIVKRWCLLALLLLLALLFVVVSCASLNQEPASKTIPGTPAGKRLSAILSLINSGDFAAMAEYIAESYSQEFIDQSSVSRHADSLMHIHTNTGKLELHSVRSSSRYRIIAVLEEALMDKYMAFGIAVEKRKPFRIDSVFYGPADSPYDSSGVTSEGQLVAEMESVLEKLEAADVFSGVILIAKDDRVLLQKAYGFADRASMISNTVETRFNMASVGKLFTTVAIAQLLERGELSLDDPLGSYLGPDWILKEIGEKVKIRHLLTHTSGLGDYLENPGFKAHADQVGSLNDYKPYVVTERLQFEPGARWSYSNTGFLLLGVVVEKATGQSYHDYLREHVFEPSGMAGTLDVVFEEGNFPAPKFAIGYAREYSEQGMMWRDNLELMRITKAGPAGGGFITAGDLLKFSVALKNGTLIAEETRDLFWSRNPELGAPHQGYGFEVETKKGESMVGHGGSHEGIGAMFRIYVNSGYTLIVFSNCGRMMAFSLTSKFADLVL